MFAGHPAPSGSDDALRAFWSMEPAALLRALGSSASGLGDEESAARLLRFGPNRVRAHDRARSAVEVLGRQLASPLLLLLVFAAAASMLTGEWADATIVLTIVCSTVAIGWSRELGAQAAIAALQAQIRARALVVRGGVAQTIPLEDVVPGDIALLSAGSLVPGDCLVLESADFYVSEAVLTGESFPVEKRPGTLPASTAVAARTNTVFLGTNVRSGSARCLVVKTGLSTEFGVVAQRLRLRPPLTEFDRGVRRFGYLLTSAMLVLVLVVFTAHVLQGRPPIETLLFAIALAVGLSPELLPAILTVNLARGASSMAAAGVVVRRLNAIENLGSMDVLCTDKTGTITEGVVRLDGAWDESGAAGPHVLDLAVTNAALTTGVPNPLDQAILALDRPLAPDVVKVAEIPFDFVRRRSSVVVSDSTGTHLIAKGAFAQILTACSAAGPAPLDATGRRRLTDLYERWTGAGIRVLAVATRDLPAAASSGRHDEHDMCFAGFLTFVDRPKEGVSAALAELRSLGVSVKIITGDSALVARHVADQVELRCAGVLTGAELRGLSDEALWHEVDHNDIFAEVDPSQKERVIRALRVAGHVVGFLGDGVNDAPAMHAADTSLSVDSAVDVARDAADFVLSRHDLDVIRQGIEQGRRTFANTLKYVLTTTSANLGNMVSMALASLFLPFLPLTAGQILLNNFLSDIPAVGLAGDSVDPELVERPRRWSMRFIGRFMVEFGLLSSAFDLLTFALLLAAFASSVETFRTAWFVESLLTELVVALVVRTRRPFFRSRPGDVLLVSTVALAVLTLAVPYMPFLRVIGFVPLPATLLLALVGITMLYVGAAELTKRWFFRHGAAGM